MTINELRIGNLVKYQGEVLPIGSLASDSTLRLIKDGESVGCYHVEWVSPITITAELLKKCGFKKHRSSDNVLDHYYIGTNPVTHDWMFEMKWVDGRSFPFYRNGYFQIKYLHQLQNLFFALTGEELTVNL